MANTLTGLSSVIYESWDVVSREMFGYIPSVTRNTTAEGAAVNQTIRIPVAPASTAADITASVSAPATGSQSIGNTTMTISKSRAVPILWTGEEQMSVKGQYNNILRDQFTQAFRTLINEVEADLAGLYTQASRAYGTAGTTPFATANNFTDFAQAKKILEDNGAPTGDLKLILGSAAIANVRGVQSSLFKANEAGTTDLLRDGVLGRVEGFDVGNSAQVKLHTKGTGTGYLVNNAAGILVGGATIANDTGSGTLLPGDVVTFAADANNKYIAATTLAGGTFDIGAPGAKVAIADNNAISIGDSYTANMAFSKSAMQLITRAPAMPVDMNGRAMDMADDVMSLTDEKTGITFQIAVYRQHRQLQYQVGLAWGVKCIKPEHCCLLIG